jgi:hypothetical protein
MWLLLVSLALGACTSAPLPIEVRIENRLGDTMAVSAYEILGGFPMVSMWTTASWDAPSGPSVRRMEACLPVHFAGVELTRDNADFRDARGTLHYTVELRPMLEGGALREPKQKGAPGIALFAGPISAESKARAASDAADFDRAVAQAGSRRKLGCWGASIFSAMERAEAR